MSETPSGNRWEPADEDTAPVTPVRPAAPGPVGAAPADETAAAPPRPSEDGWGPAPVPAPVTGDGSRVGGRATRSGPARRRTGLLASGAAAVLLAAGAGGYAIGSAAAGSAGQDFGTTRQGPPNDGPAQGVPGQDGSGDDHGAFDSPDDGADGEAG